MLDYSTIVKFSKAGGLKHATRRLSKAIICRLHNLQAIDNDLDMQRAGSQRPLL